MEVEGVVFIKDFTPKNEGAFALVCWVNGAWLRVASVDDSVVELVQRQVKQETIESDTTLPITRHGRAIVRMMCKILKQVLDEMELNTPSRNN